VFLPQGVLALGDAGLGDVVEHELEAGERLNRIDRGRELASANQQVVCEPALPHGAEPSSNIGPAEPFRIVFVVDLVPDADEPAAADPGDQRIEVIANARRREIYPPDDAPDEIRAFGKLEELARLVFARDRLHEHGSGDALSRELRCEVIWREGPSDRVEGVADHPWIRGPRGIPKVVMGVDANMDFPHERIQAGSRSMTPTLDHRLAELGGAHASGGVVRTLPRHVGAA
jgi:hypothetical protein